MVNDLIAAIGLLVPMITSPSSVERLTELEIASTKDKPLSNSESSWLMRVKGFSPVLSDRKILSDSANKSVIVVLCLRLCCFAPTEQNRLYSRLKYLGAAVVWLCCRLAPESGARHDKFLVADSDYV
jgi:hypothetical protein